MGTFSAKTLLFKMPDWVLIINYASPDIYVCPPSQNIYICVSSVFLLRAVPQKAAHVFPAYHFDYTMADFIFKYRLVKLHCRNVEGAAIAGQTNSRE